MLKNKSFIKFTAFLFLLISPILFSCLQKENTVSIMNWNVQTFFDSVKDGTEYRDFKQMSSDYSTSSWSVKKYEQRLDRLAYVIKKLDCDVVVLEELEKKEQLQDIINRLDATFSIAKRYKHGFFAKSKGSAIGCAIISRLPLSDISVHSLDCNIDDTEAPKLRPIIKASVINGKKSFVLLVNHWKSKSGGELTSDFWRKQQEAQLSRLIKEASTDKVPVLACGDFNKNIEEFDCTNESSGSVFLHGAGGCSVYSPWFTNGELFSVGSYYYHGSWEYIDNFFLAGDAELYDFKAENSGCWTDDDGHPYRYSVFNGQGYSDHLPITCKLRI